MAELSTRELHPLRGLDGLRFIGSFIILVHHVEKAKLLFGLPCIRSKLFDTGMGHAAMTLFFVLSGFLITYILLMESWNTGNIRIGHFYKRRILRIWPVYYILLILGLTVFAYVPVFQTPETLQAMKADYWLLGVFYFIHMSNFQLFFASSIKSLLHFWSMGVEEQFYAFWPWLVKKTRNYVKIFVYVIVIKTALKLACAFAWKYLPLPGDYIAILKKVEHFLFYLRFEAFACGGIAAYYFVNRDTKKLDRIFSKRVQWINILLIIISVPLANHSESIHLVFAILFSILILNMAANPQAIFCPDHPITNYIGKVSYGIYMYQVPILIFLLNILKPYYLTSNPVIWNISLYGIAIVLVLGVSILSYEYMEKKLLRLSGK